MAKRRLEHGDVCQPSASSSSTIVGEFIALVADLPSLYTARQGMGGIQMMCPRRRPSCVKIQKRMRLCACLSVRSFLQLKGNFGISYDRGWTGTLLAIILYHILAPCSARLVSYCSEGRKRRRLRSSILED